MSVAWPSVRLSLCWPVQNCRRAPIAAAHILLADAGTCYQPRASVTSEPQFVRLDLAEIVDCQFTCDSRALPFLWRPSLAQLPVPILAPSLASGSSTAQSASITVGPRSCANSLTAISSRILSETHAHQFQLWFP